MVLARALNAGDRIGLDDVDFKRPGTGIGPEEMKYVIGRTVRRNVQAEEEVEWQDLA
jgi:N-acetylneuraminate synthase